MIHLIVVISPYSVMGGNTFVLFDSIIYNQLLIPYLISFASSVLFFLLMIRSVLKKEQV